MISRQIELVVGFGFILVTGLAACSNTGTVTNQPLLTTTMVVPTPTHTLATPYAQEPAAGICATFQETAVTVTLNPDIPDPRCTKVRPDQTLTVVNETTITLTISLGNFKSSLEPRDIYSILVPFGDYLEVGVHQLTVSPCCGAELWLGESK